MTPDNTSTPANNAPTSYINPDIKACMKIMEKCERQYEVNPKAEVRNKRIEKKYRAADRRLRKLFRMVAPLAYA